MVRRRAIQVVAMVALAVLAVLPRPAGGQDWIYTVRPGDNLWDFAHRHFIDGSLWRRLQDYNEVEDPWRLPTGLRLRVPVHWLKEQPVPARVVAVSGEGTLTRAGTASSAPLVEDALLFAGDALTLTASGSATLEFADGSQLMVGPSSVLRTDVLSAYGDGRGMADTRLRLEQGRTDADVISSPYPASRFEIEAPAAVSAVRGTELRVAVADHGAAARTEVLVGSAEVSGSGGSVSVEEGFGVVTRQGEPPGDPRVLLPAPRLTSAPIFDRVPIRVGVEAVTGARAYRIEVSRSPTFDELLYDDVSEELTLRGPDLPDGRYAVRLRAIDDHGLEGHDTVEPVVIDARPEPPMLIEPIKEGKVRENPTFRWSEPEDAVGYRFQLAKTEALATPLLHLDAHQAPSLPLEQPLSPGLYGWRVATVDRSGDVGPFSDFQSFEYRPAPESPILDPAEKGKDEVAFRWRAGQPNQTYQVQLARDRAFSHVVVDEKRAEPQLAIPRPDPGRYFLRVRTIDDDGYEGPFSPVQVVEIKPENWWMLIIPIFILLPTFL